MLKRIISALPPALLAFGFAVSGAQAHPHVWVTARAEIHYAPDGTVTGIRHRWSFDEAYSAFAVQGLDKNKDGKLTSDELAELAKVNVESLHEFGFFSKARANGAKQEFAQPVDYGLVYENALLILSFTLPLKTPAQARRSFGLELFDESYFVSFTWAEGDDALRLAGAPDGCKVTVTRAKNQDAQPQGQQALNEDFFASLAGKSFGAQFANKALVACP